MTKKAAFLDRDGTINIDRGYVYRKEAFTFLPDAVAGMKKLQKMGFQLIVITNQSGIARGYYTEAQFRELNAWMTQRLCACGVRLTDSYYCPHLEGGVRREYARACTCRKPATGLFLRAVREHNIDLASSVAIGDKMRDLTICENGMTRGFLLYAGVTEKTGNLYRLSGGILQAAQLLEDTEENGAVDLGSNGRKGNTFAKVPDRRFSAAGGTGGTGSQPCDSDRA